MNYVQISVSPKEIRLTLRGRDQKVSETPRLVSRITNLEGTICEIKTTLETLKWDFSGISLLLEASILDAQGCFKNAAGELVNLVDYLQEELNKPVLTSDVFETGKDVASMFKKVAEETSWNLTYYGYTPGKKEYSVESLLTTGNGFVGLRGTLPEMEISKDHYPATYLAGLYNEIKSEVTGRRVSNEDFVNAPNLQYLALAFDDGHVLEVTAETICSLVRRLNLRNGLFSATVILADNKGRRVKIETERVVNMAVKEQFSLRYRFTPLNYSGSMTVITKSDGSVYNYNVARYRRLNHHHLKVTTINATAAKTTLAAKTTQSQLEIIQHSHLETDFPVEITNELAAQTITQKLSLTVSAGKTYTVDKNIQVRYFKPTEEAQATAFKESAPKFKSFAINLAESTKAWKKLWQQADIQVTGDLMSQKLLRLHTYHLLISGSPFAQGELDTSITARGLHGEAYRGHIFWDEIFILPFYILHFPETAKQLLGYRYNRLAAAKANAKQNGFSGAMFPWQSGLTGEEQTQELHVNPLNGEWGDDHSRLQRHVSLAIAYNVWLYWHTTEDAKFMAATGAELLLEIAEFWRSKSDWNPNRKRYDIKGVMGPDEFHEAYPDSEVGGIQNNAYTNLMVSWLFEVITGLEAIVGSNVFKKLQQKAGISERELAEMEKIRHNLTLEIDSTGHIAQYEGYFDLKEVDWEYYRKKYGNIYRMDRILRAEGESADDFKVAKQADTLMTFYNLSETKVNQLLTNLNYVVPADYLTKNLNYYLARTSHGSTLSRIVHAELAEMVGKRDLSWQLYQEALRSDYRDIQGGTTAEGIHTGVMAATLYVTLKTYAGLEIRNQILALAPDLPDQWGNLAFKFKHRGISYDVSINKASLAIQVDQETEINLKGQMYHLPQGETVSIDF